MLTRYACKSLAYYRNIPVFCFPARNAAMYAVSKIKLLLMKFGFFIGQSVCFTIDFYICIYGIGRIYGLAPRVSHAVVNACHIYGAHLLFRIFLKRSAYAEISVADKKTVTVPCDIFFVKFCFR